MNPCTDDACNPDTGDCGFTIDNTNNCVADEFFCTVDVCDDGECLPIDVNPCPCGCNEVTDSCNPCPPGGGGSGQSRGTPQAAKRCPGYCDLPQYRDYLTECLQCRQIPPPTIPQEEIAIGQTPTFAYFNIPPREQSEQQAARQPTLAGQAPSQRQPTRQTGPAMVYQEAQKPSYQSVGLAIGILLTFTILLYYAFFKRWH